MRRITIIFLSIFSLFVCLHEASAQGDELRKVIQFSGILVTGDSLSPVPFAAIWSDSRPYQGTMTDYFGFFSIATIAGDTVNFSSLGYRPSWYVVPVNVESNRMSVVHFMRRDTIQIPTTFVYPWPSKERFKEEFLALDLPDDNIQRAKKNLDPEQMYSAMVEMGMGANENFKYAMNIQHDKLRYANQAPPIQILNPIAWAKFIQAWRDGDFKRKE